MTNNPEDLRTVQQWMALRYGKHHALSETKPKSGSARKSQCDVQLEIVRELAGSRCWDTIRQRPLTFA
jgi:hypothetical protein